MMRKSFWIITLLFTVMVAPTVVRADITYSVDETVGTGSIMGTITTDGDPGTLVATDILDWNLNISDGTNTFDLEGPSSGNNSEAVVISSDLSENSTQLLFNFGATDGGYLIFQSPHTGVAGPYACFVAVSTNCKGNENAIDLSAVVPYNTVDTSALSGTQVIGTVTPEPTSMLLFATGLLGIGLVMRKRLFA